MLQVKQMADWPIPLIFINFSLTRLLARPGREDEIPVLFVRKSVGCHRSFADRQIISCVQ